MAVEVQLSSIKYTDVSIQNVCRGAGRVDAPHNVTAIHHIFCDAGQQSDDCSLHVADAIAVDRLIKALPSQSQLEAVEVAFGGAILLNQARARDYSDSNESSRDDFDSDEEDEMEAEAEEEADEYRDVCDVTAQMFQLAWMSVCRLLENVHLFRLRCSTAKVTKLTLIRDNVRMTGSLK